MLKTATIYGIISGTIVIIAMILGIVSSGGGSFFSSGIFGYLIMLIALSMIFIGIKRYRDQELGGVIKFLPALGLGIAITAIAGVIYVFVWEIYSMSTNYAYINTYVDSAIAAKKAAGLSGGELAQAVTDLEELRTNYAKPYYRLPMTFLEIFPVGFIIALISAALLRNPKVFPVRS